MAASSQQLNGQIDAVLNSLRLFRLGKQDATVAEVDAVHLRKQAKAGSKSAPAPAGRAAPATRAAAPAAAPQDQEDWATF
jgi:aerotaxis receptor